ncbi:MAG TPA: histidine phosphatase family protein [Anaerolineae bacterium]|nr:histidine phosphatase family protein [Anaerolineae bacterium]
MKTLLILRHAKSSWKDADLPDHDRPLKKRGQRAATQMGRQLAEKALTPQLILSSTALRAHETAELFAAACGYTGEIVLRPDFYAAAPPAYLAVLRELDDAYLRVMVVGHNPGLESLVKLLTDRAELMPPAALAYVELPIKIWAGLQETVAGRLVDLWVPAKDEK